MQRCNDYGCDVVVHHTITHLWALACRNNIFLKCYTWLRQLQESSKLLLCLCEKERKREKEKGKKKKL
jgi:hypothetical protein